MRLGSFAVLLALLVCSDSPALAAEPGTLLGGLSAKGEAVPAARELLRAVEKKRWAELLKLTREGLEAKTGPVRRDSKNFASIGFGELLALQGAAQAELGQTEAAQWSFELARNFLAALDPDTLAGLSTGQVLLMPRRCAFATPSTCEEVALETVAPSTFTAPRVLSRPALELPQGRLTPPGAERLVVDLVVGANGRVSEPRLLVGTSLEAGYLALAGLADWRFAPAQEGGRPFPVRLAVSVPLAADAPAAKLAAWAKELDEIERSLASGDPPVLAARAAALVTEMVATLRAGGSDLLARALTLHALAESAQGQLEAAVWHWQMAQNLEVELRWRDLSTFGAAGQRLMAERLRPVSAVAEKLPARTLELPAARYPSHARKLADRAAIEVLVGADGRPRAPLVRAGAAPGPLVAALEALREARLEPTAGDKPQTIELRVALFPRERRERPFTDNVTAQPLVQASLLRHSRGEAPLAQCLWSAAQLLDPTLSGLDPASFGEGGALPPFVGLLDLPGRSWGGRLDADAPLAGAAVSRTPGLTPPRAITKHTPSFSEGARRRGTQGTVVVEIVVTETGFVRSPQLLRPLDPETDSAALESVCQWRFEPARLDGKPLAIRMMMTVSFSIGR